MPTASLPGSLQPHRPTSTGRAGQRVRIDEPNSKPNRFRMSSMPAVAGWANDWYDCSQLPVRVTAVS